MLDGLGFEPRWVTRLSGPIQIGPKPIQPSTHSFSGVMRLEHEADHPTLLVLELSMGKATSLPPLFACPACNGTALPFIGNKKKKKETMTSKETPNTINTVIKGVNKFIYLGSEIKIQALDTRFLRGKEEKTKYRISNKIFRKIGLKNLNSLKRKITIIVWSCDMNG